MPSGRKVAAKRQRHRQRGDQARPEVAQEERDHGDAQGDADQDRVAHGANRLVDQLRLVVDRRELDALRQGGATVAERLLDVRDDVGRARAREAGDAHEHRLAAGPGDAQQAVLGALADLGDGAEGNRAAVGADGDGDGAQIVEPGGLARGHHGDERVRLFEAPDRLQHGLRAQLLGDLRRAEVQRGGPLGVEDHLDLAHVAAEHLDPPDAAHARNRRLEDQLAELAQPARVDGSRSG